MRERLIRELDLTPAQAQELAPILDDTAQRLQQIRRETAQRVSETMSQSHQQMVSHLTPEQQARLRDLQQRHRRFWRWHQHPAGPSDRP
ncbi:MAG: hypothetical protein ABR526_04960 [Chthoniobacterales bacterium]